MATNLDLQEQEQLDAVKAFWKRYGSLVTWLMVLLLAVYAGWNGWTWWQRDQATKSGAMFDELERSAQAGDVAKAARIFSDLKERFPRTAFAQQGALATAKLQFDQGQLDAARDTLGWVAEKGIEEEVRTVARLRLAALQAEAKQFDAALKTLDGASAPTFEALVADRRGDVLAAQGKPELARAAYQSAWAAMSDKVDYKRLVEAKLTSMGAAPAAAAAAASAASGAGK